MFKTFKMFQKIAVCLVVAFFLGGAHFAPGIAAASETIRGVGVRGVQDAIDSIARPFSRQTNIRVVTAERAATETIETIGKGEPGFNFGMITRPLNAEEMAAYPDIKAFHFAQDGVALIVHPRNPVQGLTSEQVRDIYAGKITNWDQVGGARGTITPLTREVGSGQRVAVEGVVMGAEKVSPRIRAIGSMGGVRSDVAVDGSALGFILIGAVDKTVKSISLDGIAPTIENVKAGTYPITIPFYLITKGEPTGGTKTFIDYVLSPEGQAGVVRARLAPAPAAR